ncbi:MAG: ABC transporter permease [Patescibacteria group bacterium]
MSIKNKNYKYLGLIKELALTNFKLKYQGSVLGYLWSLVKPLMLFVVLYFVFTRIFRVGGSIEHYPIYLLLGVVLWGFFSELTAVSLGSIVQSGDLIRKVYFPRMVLVISTGVTSLITLLLNLIIVFIFMAFLKVIPSFSSLLFVAILFELFVLTIGVSFFLSALFVKFRDVAHIWEVILAVLFYATPILYPLSLVPNKIALVMLLNPAAQIIQDARYLLVTHQTATAWNSLALQYVWIPYVLPFVIFALGYRYFNKAAAKFAEEV